MGYSREYLYLYLLLILIPTLVLAQNNRPSWLDNTPSDPNYYHGIGRAPLSAENFQEEARLNAISQLAMSLSTEISISTKRAVLEINDVSNKTFAEEVIMTSLAKLKDVEFVGEYMGKKFYSVYMRYSKNKHNDNVNNSKIRAKSLFSLYTKTEVQDVGKRLSRLVKCLEVMRHTYGESILFRDVNRDVDLWTEVPYELENIFRKLTINITNDIKNPKSEYNLRGVFDQPIDEALSVRIKLFLPPPYNEQPGSFLPVEFFFSEGSGDFTYSRKKTNEVAVARTVVRNISSAIPRQTIIARLDLKSFKSDEESNRFLDRRLEKISNYSRAIFNITVSEKKNDVVAIYIKSTEGIDNVSLKRINTIMETEFKNVSDFIIKDRSTAENELKKKGFTNADACDSEECRIIIGKTLGLNKLILVDLYITTIGTMGNLLICEMRFTDIDKKTTVYIKTYKKSYEGRYILDIAEEMVPIWIKDFYNTLNPALVTFTTNAESDVYLFINNESESKILPVYEYKIDGTDKYLFNFKATGYEPYQFESNISPGININKELFLTKKNRMKSFKRSLFFPGLGQLYSADKNHPNRRNMGLIFMGAAIASIAGTGATWSGYFQDKTDYDDAYNDYRDQNVIEDINAYREIAEEKNSTMKKSQNSAFLFTGLTVGIWIGNAFEAYFGFPEYFTMYSDTGGHLGITVAASELAPGGTIGLAWRF